MEPSIKSTHAFEINKLKTSFQNITHTIDEINKIKLLAHKKLICLRDAYFKLIENNSKKVFLFCLDSFYFQYKSFQLEYDNLEKTLSFINNRMYCDYYKLYNMMIDNGKKHKLDENDTYELRQYIQYKDLEPFFEYRIEDIKDIHSNILHIITILYEHYSTRHDSMTHYNETHKIGFSISNFINTLQYENSILKEQTVLYTNYIAFFHISQGKYLKRMYSKIENFHNEVDSNIRSNVNFSIDDINEIPILNSDNDSQLLTIQESISQDSQELKNDENNILENTLNVDIIDNKDLQPSIPSTPSSITTETQDSNNNNSQLSNQPKINNPQQKMFMLNK